MQIQIRNNVFETNSSSTHAMTICTDTDFKKWQNGEVIWNYVDECFIPKNKVKDYREDEMITYEDFCKGNVPEYDLYTFSDTFKTPKKETIHAFGLYGYLG